MNDNEVKSLVALRTSLIKQFNKCKDYRSNKNAIMREMDHAKIVHETVVEIDKILKEYVKFDEK